ncbi:phage tail protein [Paraconexibacter sp.]|uniref:phage tail protein n=1 Tax=Paraconexibacter sp. TaxID=2949640 RepID=UPI003567BAAA
MSEPFLAELRLMSFNFAPRGWAPCNGQILPINQNQALFSLLGTTYGGDGRVNFALPDLRGRVAVHRGDALPFLGTKTGEESHTLTIAEMPVHDHTVQASSQNGDQPVPSVLAAANNVYAPPTNLTALRAGTVATTGSSQGHSNLQPFLVLTWCIAMQGIFPSRN